MTPTTYSPPPLATVSYSFTREINNVFVSVYHVLEWHISGQEPLCKSIGILKYSTGHPDNRSVIMSILGIQHDGDKLTEDMVSRNEAVTWDIGISGVYENEDDIFADIGIDVVSIH